MSDKAYRRRDLEPPPANSLFSPALARTSDPSTSKAAARSLDTCATLAFLAEIYQSAGAGGLTDEEAGMLSGIDGAWKRCSDLRRLGIIGPNGTTRRQSSGRSARVCVYTGDTE